MAYTYAQLKSLWIRNGGSSASADIAAAVALAESGGMPGASNSNTDGSVDRGLWQINSVHGSQSTFDVNANVKSAIAISNNGKNWNPWVTFKSGAYKKFMSPTTAANASGTPATTAGITIPGIGGGISVSGLVESAVNQVLKMLGISGGLKDMFERFGLIILGFALVIMGIHLLSSGSGGSSTTVVNERKNSGSSSKVNSASGEATKTASKKSIEGEAVEAAAIA
jgi:lysozyme-like protein